MANNKVFSLEGEGLKLTSAEDIGPHIKSLQAMQDVEEVRFQGNTLGIGACEALGKILETKRTLQACYSVILTVLPQLTRRPGCQLRGYFHWSSSE